MQRMIGFIVLVIIGLFFSSPCSARTARAARSQAPENIVGKWDAVLDAGANKYRLVLKISQGANRALNASLDSLDQPGSMDLKVDSIALKDGALHFEMTAVSASFDGVLSPDRSQIVGVWRQGGNSFPLTFRRPPVMIGTGIIMHGGVPLKPCMNPNLTADALCGTYEVFEDRVAKTGRKIALNIILLPALSAKPAPDATFYLAGGPGGAATTYASAQFMTGLRKERDVVLVDQRGTGKSNPLQCVFHTDRTDMRGYFGDPFNAEKVRTCRAELEKVANLKLYTSAIAMDDLDDVRAALGYDRVNVYGGSYGSRTSLVYLRQHPEHVRTVTVFGVAPPDAKVPLSFAKGVQHAMDRLFADCAADSACNAAFPKFREEFETVLKQFDKGPVEVNAPNVYTKQYQRFTMTRDSFVDAVRVSLYQPQVMSALPLLIHLAAEGDLGPFAGTAFQVIYQIDGAIARGMQFSVLCAEDTPFITEEDIKRESAGSFYGDARVRPTIKACADWARADVPASFFAPVKNNVPVLLVSGELDPVTPPWLAETAARSLPNSRHLLVHNATHNSYECIEKIVANFVDKGSLLGLDTSCAAQIQRLPFNIPKP